MTKHALLFNQKSRVARLRLPHFVNLRVCWASGSLQASKKLVIQATRQNKAQRHDSFAHPCLTGIYAKALQRYVQFASAKTAFRAYVHCPKSFSDYALEVVPILHNARASTSVPNLSGGHPFVTSKLQQSLRNPIPLPERLTCPLSHAPVLCHALDPGLLQDSGQFPLDIANVVGDVGDDECRSARLAQHVFHLHGAPVDRNLKCIRYTHSVELELLNSSHAVHDVVQRGGRFEGTTSKRRLVRG
eukprot:CAMPEP_0170756932 /NCGR_PEP_ID=MMETSP0437-20130122/14274_1 /TAXON_ID=0 /ORGANISM="Sexangularia sp." /LENGTH=244 /DNA_ID=CAMNT_0011096119 /DNA_START=296 /DNA_END=1030 /DNA_ORIENTATION=-